MITAEMFDEIDRAKASASKQGRLKIRDLAVGDRVAVTWYAGQAPLVGTVSYVVPNASRASGTHIKTDAGQTVRIKASMKIVRA